MDQSGPLQSTEEYPWGVTGWRSLPDPTDKQTVDKGPGVAPAQAVELVSGSSTHKWPPAG